ncbi:hypothetical protein NHF46_06200 [Arthrobacter alpinus]|nr:hypothetical protein [Arthrobacter alpinus]
MSVGATDATVGAQFAQRLAVLASCIRSHGNGFTDTGQTATATACSKSVLEGQLRLDVDQTASHDQVLGNPFVVA